MRSNRGCNKFLIMAANASEFANSLRRIMKRPIMTPSPASTVVEIQHFRPHLAPRAFPHQSVILFMMPKMSCQRDGLQCPESGVENIVLVDALQQIPGRVQGMREGRGVRERKLDDKVPGQDQRNCQRKILPPVLRQGNSGRSALEEVNNDQGLGLTLLLVSRCFSSLLLIKSTAAFSGSSLPGQYHVFRSARPGSTGPLYGVSPDWTRLPGKSKQFCAQGRSPMMPSHCNFMIRPRLFFRISFAVRYVLYQAMEAHHFSYTVPPYTADSICPSDVAIWANHFQHQVIRFPDGRCLLYS
jgi:hypothetical protein